MSHPMYLTYSDLLKYQRDPYADRHDIECHDQLVPWEQRARKRIDRLTNSRVQRMAAVPESVKRCIVELMDLDMKIGTFTQAEKPVVTSFSTDGYSESYGKALGVMDAEKLMDDLVREWLDGECDDFGVPLLYRGVCAY